MTDYERNSLKAEIEKRIKDGVCQVLGAGVSNLPLVHWLLKRGAKITVCDVKPIGSIACAAELQELGVQLICGEDYIDSLQDSECIDKAIIFRSPGMRHDLPQIINAVQKGAILTSEMELFLLLTPSKVVAITGSDGKTTTTTLTGKILESTARGRVFVGGNIGRPLLPEVEDMTENDFAVIELSSFQLQTMKHSCDTAVITNITPNHLNWHTDMEEYTLAKYNIFKNGGCRCLVLNADNELSANAACEADISDVIYFTLGKDDKRYKKLFFVKDEKVIFRNEEDEAEILRVSDIKIPGRHNVANYMAAMGACLKYLSSFEIVGKIAKSFGGVEHRLELVRVHKGVKYYNSSIDSTPTRTAAALSALKEKPIVICGGADKGVSFAPLAKALCDRAKAVILTGACREKIMSELEAYNGYDLSCLPVCVCPDFREAVEKAREMADWGDTVLLSPACTSFDAFKNFEERGTIFKNIVNSFD